MRLLISIAISVLPLVTFGQIPFSLQDRAFITSTSPLRKDLAGYWRLEEASGTRYDFSKNGNHLTSNNSVGRAAGVSSYTGNAATFVSTSSQYLSKSDNATLSVGDIDFFIAGWYYPTNLSADMELAAQWDFGNSQRAWATYYSQPANRFQFYVSSNGVDAASVTANSFGAVPVNTWSFVVAWHDSVANTINIQVNNGTVDSLSYASGVFDSSAALCLGCGFNNGTANNFWKGSQDETGIWKRVLTATERTQLYNSGSGTHFPWVHP